MSIVKTLIFLTLLLTKIKSDVPEDYPEDFNEDDDGLDGMDALSKEEIDHASQTQTEVKLIVVLEQRRKKELESYRRVKNADSAVHREADYYSVQMQERSSWIFEHKSRLIKVTMAFLALGLFLLISWKLYSINKRVEEQNEQMKIYTKQMENIIEGADKLKFVTWKDQKEGVLFVENPAFLKKNTHNLSKAEILKNDLDKLGGELNKQVKEIDSLKVKEDAYVTEIEKLKQEYENKKREVLEEGAVLAHGEGVLREFN